MCKYPIWLYKYPNLVGKHFCLLGKHGIYCRRPSKSHKVENTKWWWWYKFVHLFICCIFFISSLLILPFQTGCTYVLLSSTRVNVFHFHVARNHCSSTCFLDHICDTATVYKHQTQKPVKAANWWGTPPPQGSPSFLILKYPNLEKLPILIDFIKKKKMGLLDKKLKWYAWQLVNLNQGSFTFKNYEFQKKNTHFFIKNLPLLLNLTQFYIHGNNSNLKNELIWKTPFFEK